MIGINQFSGFFSFLIGQNLFDSNNKWMIPRYLLGHGRITTSSIVSGFPISSAAGLLAGDPGGDGANQVNWE